MDCPACGEQTVTFGVPAAYQAHVQSGTAAALCAVCLTLTAFDGEAPPAAEANFAAILEAFPENDAGAAMAIAVGLLVDSLALNRETVKTLFDDVSDAGHDPWLVLERLHAAGTVHPDADLGKARHQLEQLWD